MIREIDCIKMHANDLKTVKNIAIIVSILSVFLGIVIGLFLSKIV